MICLTTWANGHAFYAQQEIFDVLYLLRAVASPADEIWPARRGARFSLEDETLVLAGGRGSGNGEQGARSKEQGTRCFWEIKRWAV